MQDEPLNLRALDPDNDPGAAERFEQAVGARIRNLAIEAPLAVTPLVGLWSMARGFGIAACITALVTAGAMVRVNRTLTASSHVPRSVAEAIGVPPMFLAAGPPALGGRP